MFQQTFQTDYDSDFEIGSLSLRFGAEPTAIHHLMSAMSPEMAGFG